MVDNLCTLLEVALFLVIQSSLPRRDLCGMGAGIKILLSHEELQELCLMMDYDLYYHMQLL